MDKPTTVVDTAPSVCRTFEVFRITPFEFDQTGTSLNGTETVGRVFTVRSDVNRTA